MMQPEYETDEYIWAYDSLYGVGRFVRRIDAGVSLLETGTDCQNLRERLKELSQTASFADALNTIADNYTYSVEITDSDYIAAARDKYAKEGTLEFDDTPLVSRGDDPGAYVQAWVWVYDSDVERSKNK